MNTQKLENLKRMIVDCCAENFDFSFNAKNPIVRLHEPTFGAEEIFAAIMPMLETRVTMGDRVKKFEKAYGSALGYSHCVMNNSGSSANLLALSAAGVPIFTSNTGWVRGDSSCAILGNNNLANCSKWARASICGL